MRNILSQVVRPLLDLLQVRLHASGLVDAHSQVGVLVRDGNALNLFRCDLLVLLDEENGRFLLVDELIRISFIRDCQLFDEFLHLVVPRHEHQVVSVQLVPKVELASVLQLDDHLLHVDVEQCRTERRPLVHSVLEVELLVVLGLEVQQRVQSLEEQDFVEFENTLPNEQFVEFLPVDRVFYANI